MTVNMPPDPAFSGPDFCPRADGLRLAYRHREGDGPAIVFLPGYLSDMEGGKAVALDGWAAAQGRAMLRLDYSGCGMSEGDFRNGTIDVWRDDALAVIDHALPPDMPIILVGSSMGGWLALLIALRLGRRVAGLVGIAAAPDFTTWGFTDAQKARLVEEGEIAEPSEYGFEPTITTRAFWESGQRNLLLQEPIAITCPVTLLHGQVDPTVPWRNSLTLAEHLASPAVTTLLIKDGDHRLSRDSDIALLIAAVAAIGP